MASPTPKCPSSDTADLCTWSDFWYEVFIQVLTDLPGILAQYLLVGIIFLVIRALWQRYGYTIIWGYGEKTQSV